MDEPALPPENDLPIARGPSAVPPVGARVLAFVAIVVAGVCGGLIGYAIVHVQCHRACATPEGISAVVGAGIAAGGVSVVAVLVLRAMGEWRTIQRERDDRP